MRIHQTSLAIKCSLLLEMLRQLKHDQLSRWRGSETRSGRRGCPGDGLKAASPIFRAYTAQDKSRDSGELQSEAEGVDSRQGDGTGGVPFITGRGTGEGGPRRPLEGAREGVEILGELRAENEDLYKLEEMLEVKKEDPKMGE